MIIGLCIALALVSGSVVLYLTRNTLTTTGRVLIIIGMIAALAVSIMYIERKRTKSEAVWHKDAVTWSRAPLAVYWDEDAYREYNDVIRNAMKTWNDRVGCQVLTRGPSQGDALITIRAFDGTECGTDRFRGWEGKPIHERDMPASAWYCDSYVDIQIKRIGSVGLAYRVFLHELGHAIGLDHDEIGAMAATQAEPNQGDYPEYLLPSEKDVAAIKGRYCQ
jgi:hypothetical protein